MSLDKAQRCNVTSLIFAFSLARCNFISFDRGTIGLNSITLPNSLTKISQQCFFGSGLESLVLPVDLAILGNGALAFCLSLEKLTIPDGISEVSDDLLQGCSSLNYFALPDGVLRIGSRALAGCVRLETLSVPSSVVDVGDFAFASCIRLESLHLQSR